MSFNEKIGLLANDPEQLEQLYQGALKSGETEQFKEAINTSFEESPRNTLYAAWYFRLQYAASQVKEYVVSWGWAIPLAAVNAILFWLLSGDRFMISIEGFRGAERDFLPAIIILAAPLTAVFVLTYFTAVGRMNWRQGLLIGVFLLVMAAYVLLTYPRLGIGFLQEQYLTLMILHIPLLAWAGVGVFLVAQHRDSTNRFSFLIRSLEVFIVGGLFLIAGGIFTGITFGLFDALSVNLPELVQRLLIAGGLGLLSVVVVAVMYNPTVSPAEQSFTDGLSSLLALLMHFLLPLTLLVLLIYLIFILFNFRAPFENRDVLIVYNGMLFAVIALLVGATPVSSIDISMRTARWLRLGIMAVAALAIVVGLYALAAILYRTSIDRLTPNRLTFIGWNVVNIGLLLLLLLFQIRGKSGAWLAGLHRAFSGGTIAYTAWTLVVILSIPWLFGINQSDLEELPPTVQEIIYEQQDPILLKCSASPHVYLLEDGEKRWINTIETFEDRGYYWHDVQQLSCADLEEIPDGLPIPKNAGSPPVQ